MLLPQLPWRLPVKLWLHAGDRVYMRVRPANAGVVSKADINGFSVVFDFPGRKQYQPRQRYRYTWDNAPAFITGNPPSAQE